MSPNKGETAVCGSSIFVRMTGGGDHWLPINRALAPSLTVAGCMVRHTVIPVTATAYQHLSGGLVWSGH